jgi:cellobiose-specific phosphotransferase system component IIB
MRIQKMGIHCSGVASRMRANIMTVMDLRSRLGSGLATYLRNVDSTRSSPRNLTGKELNALSQFDLANVIHEFSLYLITPEVEMNFQSFEAANWKAGFGLWPTATNALAASKFDCRRGILAGRPSRLRGFRG